MLNVSWKVQKAMIKHGAQLIIKYHLHLSIIKTVKNWIQLLQLKKGEVFKTVGDAQN